MLFHGVQIWNPPRCLSKACAHPSLWGRLSQEMWGLGKYMDSYQLGRGWHRWDKEFIIETCEWNRNYPWW